MSKPNSWCLNISPSKAARFSQYDPVINCRLERSEAQSQWLGMYKFLLKSPEWRHKHFRQDLGESARFKQGLFGRFRYLPLTHTMSPTLMFGDAQLHLVNCWRLVKYSFGQSCHKWYVTTWQRYHRRKEGMGLDVSTWSVNAFKDRSIRKWPGVRTSIPPSVWGNSIRGLEFRHSSTWASIVAKSSNVRRTSQTIRRKWRFRLITATSHSTPKCRALSGAKLHWMLWSAQDLSIACSIWAFPIGVGSCWKQGGHRK